MLSTVSSPTARSSATQLVQQFKPPKSFKFPKRKFGKKGEERACVLLLIHNIFIILLLYNMYDN